MTTELDRLLTPEPEYPRDDWSRGRNQLRESVRPEVEALQARVRELEAENQRLLDTNQKWVAWDHRHSLICTSGRATLEGKD